MALSPDEILSQVLCMQGPKVSVLHSTKAKSYKMQGTVCAEKKNSGSRFWALGVRGPIALYGLQGR